MDREIIKRKISAAPEDIKDIIYSFELIDLVDKIVPENKLGEGISDKLGQLIVCVLAGVIKKTDFEDRLIALGIPQVVAKKIEAEVEEKIFNKVHDSLEKLQSKIIESEESKEGILHGIENPTPTKPIVQNPAGKNPVLDAQHNLPEGEKKVLISSAAVPSRGPMLNNFKTPPIVPPVTPTKPISQPTQPVAEPPKVSWPPKPFQPIQPSKPPQAPIPPIRPASPTPPPPPAPEKYKTDPYREPLE